MRFVFRSVRCLLGFAVAFVAGSWLFNVDLSRFMPPTWPFATTEVASGLLLSIAGACLGALVAFLLGRGENRPVLPIAAYSAGVVGYVISAAGGIQGVVVGGPMGTRWLWWCLVALTPLFGALPVLLHALHTKGADGSSEPMPAEAIAS